MSSTSPSSVLYSSDGYELAASNATAIPVGTRGLLVEGSDGTNSRFISVDTSGRQVVVGAGVAGTQSGGVLTVQGDPAGTPIPITGSINSAGTATTLAPTYVNNTTNPLSLNLQGGLRIDGVSPTGAAGPADAMYIAGAVTTAAPSYTTGQMDPLSLTTSGLLRVDGSGVTQPVSGTVTANAGTGNFNNASVSATGASAPVDTTFIGALTATTAPSYSTALNEPLSLTLAGLLRIDGVFPINATTPTTDVTFVGGAVTTAAPTYTTGQLSALSLDTAGNLRVTGFVTTNKAATSSVTSVAASATNTTLLASNANRIFASIYNESNKTAFIKLGTTASNTSYTILLMPNAYWEVPNDYTGEIDAIWSSANGNARVTELTP